MPIPLRIRELLSMDRELLSMDKVEHGRSQDRDPLG